VTHPSSPIRVPGEPVEHVVRLLTGVQYDSKDLFGKDVDICIYGISLDPAVKLEAGTQLGKVQVIVGGHPAGDWDAEYLVHAIEVAAHKTGLPYYRFRNPIRPERRDLIRVNAPGAYLFLHCLTQD
jgi:hypothetical protein